MTTRKDPLSLETPPQRVSTRWASTLKCKRCLINWMLFDVGLCLMFLVPWRPHPQVKHYHIKQNGRSEFFLSEKHCCPSIPDLVTYHRHNAGGLASRLKNAPTTERTAPPTAGLSHGNPALVGLIFLHLFLECVQGTRRWPTIYFDPFCRQVGDWPEWANAPWGVGFGPVWSGTEGQVERIHWRGSEDDERGNHVRGWLYWGGKGHDVRTHSLTQSFLSLSFSLPDSEWSPISLPVLDW